MRSPFPGMDPYLEQRWGDFHTRLSMYIGDALQPTLPAGLIARVEERVYLEESESPSRHFRPDVFVSEQPRAQRGTGATAVLELPDVAQPILMKFMEVITERSIHVIDAHSGGRIITAIELLSPSNKIPGKGRDEYLRKQRDAVEGGVNLVELDLLREGNRTTLADSLRPAPEFESIYHASIYRVRTKDQAEYYGISLRQRLPRLAIPLRLSDADVVLDLQAVFDQAYERGRYGEDIDYDRPPVPPINQPDAEWVAEQIRSARA